MDKRQSDVLDFWFRELTPDDWFGAGEKLDPTVRTRFGALHAQAAVGLLDQWAETPLGRLALIILLDQFSRHIDRGTARAFANDARAQQLALDGMASGMDEKLSFEHRHFFYMPLMHAENSALQDKSIDRFTSLLTFAEKLLDFAKEHCSAIRTFGRFPHRNQALGRPSTDDERAFLRQ